ncbi:MAG TPA: DMT family transporter [Chromobacteriaceae bacterium]|nr:DMT family transporter [Chromobacteriaceae bacterium]
MTASVMTDAAPSRLPDLVLVGVTLIWGSTFLIVQTALQWVGPFGFVALRFGVAALVALLLSWRELRRVTRAEWRSGLLIGSVLFASYSLQTMGLAEIASSKSAFLTGLYVPLVPLLQLLLFRRPPGAAAWLGIAIAFAGLVLLSDPRGMQWAFGRGEALTLAGAAMIALEICLVSRFARQCHPRRVSLVQLLVVAVLALPAAYVHGEALPQLQPGLLACVLFIGLATAGIQIAMNWAQKSVPATRATVIYAMEPVWGGLVGWLAGETLTVLGVTGALLVVTSVLVSELLPRRLAQADAA